MTAKRQAVNAVPVSNKITLRLRARATMRQYVQGEFDGGEDGIRTHDTLSGILP